MHPVALLRIAGIEITHSLITAGAIAKRFVSDVVRRAVTAAARRRIVIRPHTLLRVTRIEVAHGFVVIPGAVAKRLIGIIFGIAVCMRSAGEGDEH